MFLFDVFIAAGEVILLWVLWYVFSSIFQCRHFVLNSKFRLPKEKSLCTNLKCCLCTEVFGESIAFFFNVLSMQCCWMFFGTIYLVYIFFSGVWFEAWFLHHVCHIVWSVINFDVDCYLSVFMQLNWRVYIVYCNKVNYCIKILWYR